MLIKSTKSAEPFYFTEKRKKKRLIIKVETREAQHNMLKKRKGKGKKEKEKEKEKENIKKQSLNTEHF